MYAQETKNMVYFKGIGLVLLNKIVMATRAESGEQAGVAILFEGAKSMHFLPLSLEDLHAAIMKTPGTRMIE